MTMGMMKVHSTEPKPVAMLTILGGDEMLRFFSG